MIYLEQIAPLANCPTSRISLVKWLLAMIKTPINQHSRIKITICLIFLIKSIKGQIRIRVQLFRPSIIVRIIIHWMQDYLMKMIYWWLWVREPLRGKASNKRCLQEIHLDLIKFSRQPPVMEAAKASMDLTHRDRVKGISPKLLLWE